MKGTSHRSCNDLKPYIHAGAGRRLVADGKVILPIYDGPSGPMDRQTAGDRHVSSVCRLPAVERADMVGRWQEADGLRTLSRS